MRQHKHKAGSRRKYAAARAFFISILMVCAITAWNVLFDSAHTSHKERRKLSRAVDLLHKQLLISGISKPNIREVGGSDLRVATHNSVSSPGLTSYQCRPDYPVKDQCQFIRENCPEETGLFSYLQIYYCKSKDARPVAFIILTIWLGFLFSTIGIAASDFFCINLSTIANVLGLSESMAGVTLLAFGNGSPDVFSTFAAMKTHSGSLAIGELIGAAGFITTVVAGSMAIVRPFKVAQKSFVRDVGFFIIASSFSLIFLADGHLHLWESTVMVGFYIFYVITVVVWHWNFARKSYRREREVAARGHFHVGGTEDVETDVCFDDCGDRTTGPARSPLSARSVNNPDNLESGRATMLSPMGNSGDDEIWDHWVAEINGNMRVSRPRPGQRRKTQNPIRPSFVGALELRSVLMSLQNSRNVQSIPINLRRYSDTTALQQHQTFKPSNRELDYNYAEDRDATSGHFRPSFLAESDHANRRDEVSSDGDACLEMDPNPLPKELVPEIDLLDATPLGSAAARGSYFPQISRYGDSTRTDPTGLSTPRISIFPPPPESSDPGTASTPVLKSKPRSLPDLLAPLGDSFPWFSEQPYEQDQDSTNEPQKSSSKFQPPQKTENLPSRCQTSSPGSNSTTLHSPVLQLVRPSVGSELTCEQNGFNESVDRPVRWWPYKFLPPPQVLISTLFPTLYAWPDKNIWERLIGLVAAPSVFLLAITLPVVEAENDDATLDPDPGILTPYGNRSRSQSMGFTPSHFQSSLTENRADERHRMKTHLNSHEAHSLNLPLASDSDWHNGNVSKTRIAQLILDPSGNHQDPANFPSGPHDSSGPAPASPKEWNRWLLAIQIFTAPFLIIILYWVNNDPTLSGRNLLFSVLCGLIVSSALFVVLLLTTTVSRPPRYHFLFCFLGFIVSIAWISTIASEVVGVLKAFGFILGISDAILGLTIFAVGNSLGDLVANITVARLGYPVMALSACFGGPMLNILLGIGLSGLYMTIKAGNGRHDQQPDKPMNYQPYQIDVGRTLIISGITLLVTLLGLLIVVPLNRWRMDKRIGWGLVGLWTASTVGNVIMEVFGV